jgi:hypothetical protein
VFIDAVDATLGAQIPEVDVAAVMRTDPFTPAALRAQGVACP